MRHVQHCLTTVTACCLYRRCLVYVNSGDEFCSVVYGTSCSLVVKKVNFTLKQGTKAQKRIGGIALLFP